MSKFAQIIIDLSVENVDKAFSYKIPTFLQDQISIGSTVIVPFGAANKPIKGYVIGLSDTTDIQENKLKDIVSINTEVPDTDEYFVALSAWISHRYGCTMSKALNTVTPVKLKVKAKESSTIRLIIEKDGISEILDLLRSKRRTTWIRLIDHLMSIEKTHEDSYKHCTTVSKANASTIKAMVDAGYIEIIKERHYRSSFDGNQLTHTNLVLNTEQTECVDVFRKDYSMMQYYTYLLFGITGSGKTEVYIEMIKEVIKSGRQVIVLVPEISLTYQTIIRLTEAFGKMVAVIHSKLSPGERYDQFQRAMDGDAQIMIGPRSAMFTPFSDLGLIIMDEEHDTSYKNENVPRYNSVDVARKRAELSHASLVLSSATPSPESYCKALDGEYKLLKLTHRAVENSTIASTHIVDMREELNRGNKSIFSKLLDGYITERLEKHEQIMLFMNRRGYSGFVSCRSCGTAIMCPHCDVSLTLHENNTLICHYCGYSTVMPKHCPSCGSPHIAAFGTGTQKLESLTKKMYPFARVLRMDADTSSAKNSGRDILRSFAEGDADILVGTQMIVKGHDFPRVSLVGIMAADTSLYVSNYMSSERTFELITQAAGRAGRGHIHGDVVIQTYNPDHFAITAAASQNYELYFNQEMAFRKLAGYPPAIHIWTIFLSSRDKDALDNAGLLWKSELESCCNDMKVQIIGPTHADIYKLKDYYRDLLYIKHTSYDILLQIKDMIEYRINNNEIMKNVSSMYDFT